MRLSFGLVISLFLLRAALPAQSFDVASVHEITDPEVLRTIKSGEITYRNGTVLMSGVTLGYAVQWAFDIQNYQLEGPAWIHWRPANDQPRYNIVGKTQSQTPKATARVMARNLLVERFGLAYHLEDRQRSGYVLREAPTGLKIERIAPTDENPLMSYANNKLEFKNMNIQELCGDIALSIKEPVVNGTSLGEQTFNAAATVIYDRSDELFSALLGALKRDMGLVPTKEKVTVKTVVVERINQAPTAN